MSDSFTDDGTDLEFVRARKSQEAMRLRRSTEDYLKSIEKQAPPEAAPEPDESFLRPVGRAALREIVGVVETPMQVLGGVRDAGQEVLEGIDSVAGWLNDNVADMSQLDTGLEVNLPDVPEAQSVTGGMVRDISQFVTGFVPAIKAVRGMTGGIAASRTGKFAQTEAAAALSSALVFDPHESRLSNLIESYPALQNPVTEYLSAQPDDSEAEGRFKSALEGLALGPLAEGLAMGVRAIKAHRKAKGVEIDRPLAEPEESIVAGLGDPDGPLLVKKEVMEGTLTPAETKFFDDIFGSQADLEELLEEVPSARYEGGKLTVDPEDAENLMRYVDETRQMRGPGEEPLPPSFFSGQFSRRFSREGEFQTRQAVPTARAHLDEPLPFRMNWARLSSSEDIDLAINDVAQVYKEQIDEARRGTITVEQTQALADDMGMSVEELLQRNAGQAFNAEQIVAARKTLEAATTQLVDLARAARLSSDEATQFQFRKMLDIHAALQMRFQGAASEAGRALRALRIPAGTKEGQVEQIRQVLMNDGGPDKIRQLAEAISAIDDPSMVNKAVRRSLGERTSDAIVEYWYFALLSGPQTHAVNVLSTATNAAWQVPERFLAGQFSKLRNPQGVQAGEASALMYGYVSSLYDAVRLAGRAAWTGEQSDVFGKVEARTQEAITSENFNFGSSVPGQLMNAAVDGFGTFVRTPTRALMAEDEFFRTVGRGGQMRALAFRKATQEGLEGQEFAARVEQLVRNPTQQMIDSGFDFSRDVTFTTPLGTAGRSLQTAINRHPWAKSFAPFVRTPANLFKWAGRRSPLAPLAQSIRNDVRRGGPEGDLALARMAMGTGTAMLAADLALRGLVTGSGPADKELRKTWMRTNQPFSFKLGDRWYSYNRGDPFGMLVGAAASYSEIAGFLDEGSAEEIASAIALATSRSVLNKTWMRGVTSAVEAVNDPDRYLDQFVQDSLGTFLVPTGVAQFTRINDPYWREVHSLIDAAKARLPGYSEELPPWRNLWGEAVHLEGGLGPDIISPIYSKKIEQRPVDTWMLDNRVNVSMPGRTRMDVELTPHEYDKFVALAGNELKDPLTGLGAYDTLNAIIEGNHPRSYLWERATDGPEGGRALLVKTVINQFRDRAWGQMLRDSRELRTRVENRAIEKQNAMRETNMSPSAGAAP